MKNKIILGEVKANISYFYSVHISMSQKIKAFYMSSQNSREDLFPHKVFILWLAFLYALNIALIATVPTYKTWQENLIFYKALRSKLFKMYLFETEIAYTLKLNAQNS